MSILTPKHIAGIVYLTLLGVVLLLGVACSHNENDSLPIEDSKLTLSEIYIESVRYAESGGNQLAVSPMGAIGSMQVIPTTAEDPGFGVKPAKKHPDGSFDLNDIDRLGADYLQAMLKRYDGDFEAALVAYNAGPGNADMWVLNGKSYDVLPDSEQTREYVERTYTVYHHLLADRRVVS